MRAFSRIYSTSYLELRKYPIARFANEYGEAIEEAKHNKERVAAAAKAATRSRKRRR